MDAPDCDERASGYSEALVGELLRIGITTRWSHFTLSLLAMYNIRTA